MQLFFLFDANNNKCTNACNREKGMIREVEARKIAFVDTYIMRKVIATRCLVEKAQRIY